MVSSRGLGLKVGRIGVYEPVKPVQATDGVRNGSMTCASRTALAVSTVASCNSPAEPPVRGAAGKPDLEVAALRLLRNAS